jgi:hypothetical protein
MATKGQATAADKQRNIRTLSASISMEFIKHEEAQSLCRAK